MTKQSCMMVILSHKFALLKKSLTLTLIIPVIVLTSILQVLPYKNCLAIDYYVATNGNDQNNGTLSYPWRTIGTSIAKLRPGDILYVRGGTYYQSNIRITVSGTAANKITIRNYPNETPIVDGGFRQFRRTGNSDWELYDAARGIYRSTRTYPNADSVQGYFRSANYRLVPYTRYANLSSANENYVRSGSIYIGPGIFWNRSDARIYIRLKPSNQEISMGYNIPSNTDPRAVGMYIFQCRPGFNFLEACSHIDVVGINFQYQDPAINLGAGTHHITITNSDVICGKTAVMIRENAHDLVVDNIRDRNYIPPWIAWSDVKVYPTPGEAFSGTGINIPLSSYNIEVTNCLFDGTWDGIDTGYAHGLHIHHNTFLNTRDDVAQLGSNCYDIEINHNKMLFVSKGISRHGSGEPLNPGTKYIHHNIIDCSRSMLGGRYDPNNLLDNKYEGPNGDRMVWARPFGSHEGEGHDYGDPWKIYNNTLIFGRDLNNNGAGHEYSLTPFYPGIPQEVYNNIIIQTMDFHISRGVRVADGSQILDGNIYYRSNNSDYYSLRLWENGSETDNFTSLSSFKSSQYYQDSRTHYAPGFENSGVQANPQLDSNYYPNPNGPAANGAVPLPPDWPGQDYGGAYRGALPPL